MTTTYARFLMFLGPFRRTFRLLPGRRNIGPRCSRIKEPLVRVRNVRLPLHGDRVAFESDRVGLGLELLFLLFRLQESIVNRRKGVRPWVQRFLMRGIRAEDGRVVEEAIEGVLLAVRKGRRADVVDGRHRFSWQGMAC